MSVVRPGEAILRWTGPCGRTAPRRIPVFASHLRNWALGTALAIALLALAATAQAGEVFEFGDSVVEIAPAEVGDVAPDFEGKEFYNTDEISLKQLRGRIVLFELFSTG